MKTNPDAELNKAQPCGFDDLVINDGIIVCKVCGQVVNKKWIENSTKQKIAGKL
jgi:transcription initiation factor TFIIIB Brf1 subunit/transcription initiation factor TFIIB